MRRFPSTGSDRYAETAFRIGEIAAAMAFVILTIAVLSGPYLIGLLPEVEAEFIQGEK